MNRPIRVLVISFLPPSPGGIATWAGILRSRPPCPQFSFQFEEVGGGSDRLLRGVRLVIRTFRRLGRNETDVVHLNTCLSPLGLWRDLAIAGIARARGVPLLVHHRGSLPDVFVRLPAASRFALRRLLRAAALNLCVNRESAAFAGTLGDPPPRTEYMPPFVDDESAPSARTQRSRRPFRAAYAGRLSHDKGSLDLLEAARALPEVEFVMMGEAGDVRHALGAAPPNVVLTGHLSRAEVFGRLLESDVFVFPSRREGSPNAVLEAMASGLPVVATRTGGLPDLISNGEGGYLVPVGDADSLIGAVRRLAADPERAARMGAHNRAVCADRFTFSRVFERLSAAYETIVSGARTSAPSVPLGSAAPATGPGVER